MGIDELHGVIEIGHVWLSPAIQRSRAGTEAIFLLTAHAFDDLGYRRLEWKRDSLNVASRRAAERLGFTFEGIFRQAAVIKGHNRDTAWFSIIDREWPLIGGALREWLSLENFDELGQQQRSVADVRMRSTCRTPSWRSHPAQRGVQPLFRSTAAGRGLPEITTIR